MANIAKICAVSRPTVSAWFNLPEKVATISRRHAEIICDAYGLKISPAWLAEGIGQKDVPRAKDESFDSNVKPAHVGMRAYPVISKIQAGRVKEMSCPYEPGDGYGVVYGDNNSSPWAFFLEVDGDSMLPEFNEGDLVLIDPEVIPRPGDYVAARNSKREATFKKYRVRGISELGVEIFELVPLNEDYATIRSDEHSLVVIGTMVEHRRSFRRK
jgi:SOS-response transcriptional repressor LexA